MKSITALNGFFWAAALLAAAGCSQKAEPPPQPKPAEQAAVKKEEPAAAKQAPEPKKEEAPKPASKAVEPPPGKPTANASSGEGEYKASLAFDGDFSTRWGSDFTDNQWIVFDLGESRDVAGARIDWETAYGKDYDLLVSIDKSDWKKVCEVRNGDGGVDEVFFKPVKARFVKLQGLRRGTGWGYSIYELQTLKAEDLPAVTAMPAEPGQEAQNALDGDAATAWSSTSKEAKTIDIDLRKVRSIGGLELLWKENPGSYTISLSKDEKTWDEVCKITGTDGGTDLVFFKPASCRKIRISIPAGAPAGLAEAGLKGGEEDFSLVRQFEALASRLPDGSMPRWLKRNQTFWTITGVPDDTEETLIGEEGTVEPYKGSFCIMPFLQIDGKTLTEKNLTFTHELEDGALPLPTVHFKKDGAEIMDLGAFTFGSAGESTTAVRYRVHNNGKEPMKARLNLVVWPLQLNPPWQYGGVAPIKTAALQGTTLLQINGRNAVHLLTPPTAAGVLALRDGDAFSSILAGKAPAATEAGDPEGAVSGVFQFDLEIPAGQSRSIVALLPLHEKSRVEPGTGDADEFYKQGFDKVKKAWLSKLTGWSIRCKLPQMENVVRSNLGYMVLNRDLSAAQPGPRNYSHAWMRDGSVSTATYLRFGFNDEARTYLEWFTPLVRTDGFVPFLVDAKTGKMLDFANTWKEYDSQGEYVYAVKKYYDTTGDKKLAEKWFPAVERAMAYLKARLDERRTDKYKDTKFFGILPESNSHEGYFPGVHSYWDDFWALRGLGDAAALADALGKNEAAQKFRDEQDRLRKDFFASIKKTMALGRKDYIPGCAEKADFDPTSTSIGLTACGELTHLMEDPALVKALKRSYDMYVDGLKPRYTPGAVWGSYTPYEARNVEALVRLGRREDAARLFEFFTGSSMRPTGWNSLGEVVHYEPPTGSYIGDMPHTWVGADLINAARSFFVLDDGPVIEIAPGVPASWLEGGKAAEVENLPTATGKITYKLARRGPEELALHVEGTAKPAGGFIFRSPFASAVKSAKVNGVETPYDAAGVKFGSLPADVVLTLEK